MGSLCTYGFHEFLKYKTVFMFNELYQQFYFNLIVTSAFLGYSDKTFLYPGVPDMIHESRGVHMKALKPPLKVYKFNVTQMLDMHR